MALCQKCSAIPFQKIFDVSHKPRKYPVMNLNHARESRVECAFCSFLVEAYELAYDRPPSDRLQRSQNMKLSFEIFRHAKNLRNEEPWFEQLGVRSQAKAGSVAWLRFSNIRECRTTDVDDHMICVSYIPATINVQEEKSNLPGLVPRRRDNAELQSCRLNYKLIHDWLRICVKEHGGLCRRATDFKRRMLKLKLIDVRCKQVRVVDDNTPYVALSYVWGQLTKQDALGFWNGVTPKSKCIDLPQRLPQTIEDAITFTQNVNVQYLWVDAYCIDQKDDHELHSQIGNMHLVFECAFLTIAAMDSNNSGGGICGISRNFLQMHQPSVKTSYGEFTATYVPSIWLRQGSSPWELRAWTLQEMVLSRRILLFDENSVRMKCENEMFHDLLEVNSRFDRPHFQLCDNYFWENGFSIKPYDTDFTFLHYDILVSNYTRRTMKHQSDALFACLGALNQITRNTGVGFIQGLPRADIHLALLWKPHHRQSLTKRAKFPSWSWIGWVGHIEYHYCLTELAGYAEQGQAAKRERSMKRMRHTEVQESVLRNNEAFITETHDRGLQASSHIARVEVRKVREKGRIMKRSRTNSEHSGVALGDHWVVLNKSGNPLINQIGEVTMFENIDYSFQVNPVISDDLDHAGGICELLFIRYFPWLRDHGMRGKDRWLFDHVGCLVILGEQNNGRRARRIGFIFVRLEDWLTLNPCLQTVELV